MSTDLSLVPTLDLMAELKRRCDAGVIIMRRVHTPEVYALTAHEWGSSYEVIGLMRAYLVTTEARMSTAFPEPGPEA